MATIDNHRTHRKSFLRRAHRPHAGNGDRRAAAEVFSGVLDDACRKLSDELLDPKHFNRTLDELILALRSQKLCCGEEPWQELVRRCRAHPIKDVLHEDPFTFRAYAKPRGYPGDAELLDYIYGREEQWPAPEASPIGRRIFDYTTLAPAPEGVRCRRGFVAGLLDRLSEETPKPHVLSVAAGHLREASLSAAVKRKRLGRFVALDNDPESLEEVRRCYSCFGVETVNAGIRRLLTAQFDIGRFDLVYSMGLFDYLRQAAGRRLVWGMFQMLRPGGRVVVANFLPGVRDVGYMEVFMDWQLVYRTRREMIDMTMDIRQPEIREIRLFAEENQNIIFVMVTKN